VSRNGTILTTWGPGWAKPGDRPFRVLFSSSTPGWLPGEVDVWAPDADSAEERARHFIHLGPRDTTQHRRSDECWSVIDLTLYPDPMEG
jgi:hypothetical protein